MSHSCFLVCTWFSELFPNPEKFSLRRKHKGLTYFGFCVLWDLRSWSQILFLVSQILRRGFQLLPSPVRMIEQDGFSLVQKWLGSSLDCCQHTCDGLCRCHRSCSRSTTLLFLGSWSGLQPHDQLQQLLCLVWTVSNSGEPFCLLLLYSSIN